VGIFVILGLIYPSLILGNIAAALLHGFVKGLLAVTAGHQMSHFALFSRIPLNTFIFRVCSPLVLSTHNIWSTSHVISHHIHTLTPDDLQVKKNTFSFSSDLYSSKGVLQSILTY
jgi:fatty acid desaturase